MSTDFMSRPAAMLISVLALIVSFAPAPDGWIRRPPVQASSRSSEVILGVDASLNALSDEALEDRLGVSIASRSLPLSAVVVSPTEDTAGVIGRLQDIEGVLYAEPNR